ncbi:hypothetical protein BSKO_00789 [Bryopsis sp. KO-2023]|nr:hypothetical protein BSKO_00789 [Bryopsis sp. KO-2023]
MAGLAFHVACPHTGTAICYCSLGNPPSVSDASKSQKYFQEAKKLWEIWKNSHNLFDKPHGVDVLVPILYKREIMPFDDCVDETVLPTQQEAEQNIEEAEKAANDAAFRAARISTAAGVQYQLPSGVEVDLSSLSKPERAERSSDAIQKEILKTEAELKSIEEERSSLDAKTVAEEQDVKAALVAAQQKLTEMQMIKKRGRPRQSSQMLGNIDTRELEPIPVGVRPKRGRRAPREERRFLRKSEFSPSLIGRQLQVFWPPDKTWWTVAIRDIQLETNTATLLYDTGETEEVDFKKLIDSREVAWPVGEEPSQVGR